MISFGKYQGTGNDFIVLEGDAAVGFDAASAPLLCDRHFGIGADGVLLVLPPTTRGARGRMRVINADGSEPEMCGNGLRCVALALARGDETFVIDTGAGPKVCEVSHTDDGASVTVSMGNVRYLQERTLESVQGAYLAHLVDAGNPHAILFGDVDAERRGQIGPLLETHPAFPNRTNVEFARVVEDRIELVVWERGVGFTLACGTGACATAVAAWHTGRLAEARTRVDLPGGALLIERAGADEVRMTGPARRVFTGGWRAPSPVS